MAIEHAAVFDSAFAGFDKAVTKIDLKGVAVEMPHEGDILTLAAPRSFPITLRREA